MIVPERWLRSFCDPAIDAEALAHQLTMAGIEVESCAPAAPAGTGVVAAQVLAVEKHPQADKLTVCKVDAGHAFLRDLDCFRHCSRAFNPWAKQRECLQFFRRFAVGAVFGELVRRE